MCSPRPRSREAFRSGIEHHLRGRYREAIDAFQEAIDHDPTSVMAHYWLGRTFLGGRNWKEAIAALSDAIALDSQFTAAYDLRCVCHQALEDMESYREDYRVVIEQGGPAKGSQRPDELFASVYTCAFLDEARREGIDVASVVAKMPQEQLLWYPDGSLQLDGEEISDKFWERVGSRVQENASARAQLEDPHMRGPIAPGGYMSLSHFPVREYRVILWGDFVKQYEGGRLRVVTCRITDPAEGEVSGPIDNLPVTVAFHRRLAKRARGEFAALVARYLDSVSSEGLFGEGPVRAVSREIDFFTRAARFRIDASHSGQNTINWLILSLVAYSSVNPVLEIYFTEHPCHQPPVFSFEQHLGLSEEEKTQVPIPAECLTGGPHNVAPEGAAAARVNAQPAALAAESDVDESSYVPPGARPFEDLHSEHFKVLVSDAFEPWDLKVTLYFEQSPKVGEQDQFSESLRNWLSLGEAGGFGAPGFRRKSDSWEIEYDATARSATLHVDMGSADCDVALRVLVNMLEEWHVHGTILEAVVLGRNHDYPGIP